MMTEYPKIEALFERETNGSKKLVEGRYCNPAVEYLAGNVWSFTEKIDGTNVRIHWNGHKVEFAGRTDRAQMPKQLLDYLSDTFGTPETEELFEQKFGDTDVILIGDFWLRRDDLEDVARTFGIDVVPVIFEGTMDEAVRYVKGKPKSTFGTADMEGLVGRPVVEMRDRVGKRVITKIKVCDFVS